MALLQWEFPLDCPGRIAWPWANFFLSTLGISAVCSRRVR
jgi:hypothetical protein